MMQSKLAEKEGLFKKLSLPWVVCLGKKTLLKSSLYVIVNCGCINEIIKALEEGKGEYFSD